MDPEKGDNAIWKIFSLLSAFGGSKTVEAVYEYMCTPLSCEKFGFSCEDEQSGDTTFNLGVANTDGKALKLTLNIRIPVCCDKEKIIPAMLAKMPEGTKITETMFSPNLFIDKDAPLVKTLLKVYADVTGNETYCIKTGGGTYAKELPRAVAFGPTFPNTVTNLHNADENLPVPEFEALLPIYRAAMLALDKATEI